MIALKVLMVILATLGTTVLGMMVMRWLLRPFFHRSNRTIRMYLLWTCRVMDWHSQPQAMGFDGCSATGCCPICGRRVLLDSQGNWFACSQQPDYQEPTP